jgi:hypothetical protein
MAIPCDATQDWVPDSGVKPVSWNLPVTQRRKETLLNMPPARVVEEVELPQETPEEVVAVVEEEPVVEETPKPKLEPKPVYTRPTTPLPPRETAKHPRNTPRYTQ